MIATLAPAVLSFRCDLSPSAMKVFTAQAQDNTLLNKRISEGKEVCIKGFKLEFEFVAWLRACGFVVAENDESNPNDRGFDLAVNMDGEEIKLELKLVFKETVTIKKHCRAICRGDDGSKIWILIWQEAADNVVSLGAIRGDNLVELVTVSKLGVSGGYYVFLNNPSFRTQLLTFK